MKLQKYQKCSKVTRGLRKAEFVLKNARIVNVFTREILEGDIAIQDGMIVGIGNYQGEEETFVCVCGYKEKLSSFQARRTKEGAGVNKRDVQKYLKKQQKEAAEPVNNAFAQALSGIKLD